MSKMSKEIIKQLLESFEFTNLNVNDIIKKHAFTINGQTKYGWTYTENTFNILIPNEIIIDNIEEIEESIKNYIQIPYDLSSNAEAYEGFKTIFSNFIYFVCKFFFDKEYSYRSTIPLVYYINEKTKYKLYSENPRRNVGFIERLYDESIRTYVFNINIIDNKQITLNDEQVHSMISSSGIIPNGSNIQYDSEYAYVLTDDDIKNFGYSIINLEMQKQQAAASTKGLVQTTRTHELTESEVLELQAAEIQYYKEELEIKLDLNYQICETIVAKEIISLEQYGDAITLMRTAENGLENGFQYIKKESEINDFIEVSNFINETADEMEKKYNDSFLLKKRIYYIAEQISINHYELPINVTIKTSIDAPINTQLTVRDAINIAFQDTTNDENLFLNIKLLTRIAEISQIAIQIDEKYINFNIKNIPIISIIQEAFLNAYNNDDAQFQLDIELLSKIAKISQIAIQIHPDYYGKRIEKDSVDENGNAMRSSFTVEEAINGSFNNVLDEEYNEVVVVLTRIAMLTQIAEQIDDEHDDKIVAGTESTVLQYINYSFKTVYYNEPFNSAIDLLKSFAEISHAQKAGAKIKQKAITKNRYDKPKQTAGAKMTGGAMTNEEITTLVNNKGHFYVNGEIFDPTWTPWINEFGKEKILYSIMFGIEVSMKKYIEELEKMAGGVGSSDKNSKRASRLKFLNLAYYSILQYDENPEHITRPLDNYFKRMLGCFNGSAFNFTTNNGIGHSGAKTGKVLFEIWAGGNIITCFAQLLQNIILHIDNGAPLDGINATPGFEGSMLYQHMINVLYHTSTVPNEENEKKIKELSAAINEVAVMPYSDFDANGCILIEDETERDELFAGSTDPQGIDYFDDAALDRVKEHLEYVLNKDYFLKISESEYNSQISGFNIFRIKNKYAFKKSNEYIELEGVKEAPDVSRKNIVKGLNEFGADKLFVGGVEKEMFAKIQIHALDKKSAGNIVLSDLEFFYLDRIFKSDSVKQLVINYLMQNKRDEIATNVGMKLLSLKQKFDEIVKKLEIKNKDGTHNKTTFGSAKKFISENSLLFCDMLSRHHKEYANDNDEVNFLIKFGSKITNILQIYGSVMNEDIIDKDNKPSNKLHFKQLLMTLLIEEDKDKTPAESHEKVISECINNIETVCNATGTRMTNADGSTPIQDCLIKSFNAVITNIGWKYNDETFIGTKFIPKIMSITQKKTCIDAVISEIKRIEEELKMNRLHQIFVQKYSHQIFDIIKHCIRCTDTAPITMEETATKLNNLLNELFLKNILEQISTLNMEKIITLFNMLGVYLNKIDPTILEEELKNQNNSEMRNYIIDLIDSEEILLRPIEKSIILSDQHKQDFVTKFQDNATKYSSACVDFYKMLLLQKKYNNALTSFNVECTIETMQLKYEGGTKINSIIKYLNGMMTNLNIGDEEYEFSNILPLTHSLYSLNLNDTTTQTSITDTTTQTSITKVTNQILQNFFASEMTAEISKYTTQKIKAYGLLFGDTGETLELDDHFDKLTNVANACIKHIPSDKSCHALYPNTEENPANDAQCSQINKTSSINAAELKAKLSPIVQENIELAVPKMTPEDVRAIVPELILAQAADFAIKYAATMVMSFLYLTSNNVMIPTHMNDDVDLADAVEDGCRIDSMGLNDLGFQIPRVACGVGGGRIRRKIRNNIKIKKTKKNKKREHKKKLQKTKHANPRKTKRNQLKKPNQKKTRKPYPKKTKRMNPVNVKQSKHPLKQKISKKRNKM